MKDKYSSKKINGEYYGKTNISSLQNLAQKNEDGSLGPGYVLAPFIAIESSKERSKEYDEFMKKYHENHSLCPNCKSNSYSTTLVGYILDWNNKEDYKDLNNCRCVNCNDVHTMHERLPFLKK